MSQQRSKESPPPAPSNRVPGILSAVIVLVVLGLIGGLLITRANPASEATAPTPEVVPTESAAVIPTAVAVDPAAPVPGVQPTATRYNFDAPPPMTIDPAKRYTATIITPRGEVVAELLPELAPQSVNNFVFLARENFYNGLTWHRVLPDFMAQGGDPEGTGAGGPGYSIPAEFTDEIRFDQPGLLAMARSSDPDSAGSQFFITTGAAPWLDSQYTIFGRVISGQEFVNAIPLRDPSNPADLAQPGEAILGITISEE